MTKSKKKSWKNQPIDSVQQTNKGYVGRGRRWWHKEVAVIAIIDDVCRVSAPYNRYCREAV